MNSVTRIPLTARPEAAHSAPIVAGNATPTEVASTSHVLRNTYALLSMTLLFSAAIAAASVAFQLPAPDILLTLGGYFGLLFAVYKFKNSGWALPAVFALTGFMGYALGPMVALLSAGLILFETRRIVTGGEANYVLATAGL